MAVPPQDHMQAAIAEPSTGKILTGELKNGAVADKVGKALADDTPPPEGD